MPKETRTEKESTEPQSTSDTIQDPTDLPELKQWYIHEKTFGGDIEYYCTISTNPPSEILCKLELQFPTKVFVISEYPPFKCHSRNDYFMDLIKRGIPVEYFPLEYAYGQHYIPIEVFNYGHSVGFIASCNQMKPLFKNIKSCFNERFACVRTSSYYKDDFDTKKMKWSQNFESFQWSYLQKDGFLFGNINGTFADVSDLIKSE